MPVTINGTTGVVFPDGVTQGSGVPTASGTSGAPLVSNGTIYTQNTAVGVAFGGTGATDAGTARSNLGTNDAANITTGTLAVARGGTGNANGSANSIANSGGWSVTPSGTKLFFNYNGANVASLDSSGNLICLANITAYGTP